jgi:hypothetical protein
LLFINIVSICCNSRCLLLAEMGYVFILLDKYRIAEFLCSVEWQELLCMIRSVVVGFAEDEVIVYVLVATSYNATVSSH